MRHTIQINTSQLNSKFIESVQSMFANRNVKIVIEAIEPHVKDLAKSEIKRFLDHRKNHPSVKIYRQDDFNKMIDDINF